MNEHEQALLTPITLPRVAIWLTLATAFREGINAGCIVGPEAHAATDATVNAYMDRLIQASEELRGTQGECRSMP